MVKIPAFAKPENVISNIKNCNPELKYSIMKEIKWTKIIISLTISIAIELCTFKILPTLQEHRYRHEASNFDYIPLLYLLTSVSALTLLIISLTKYKLYDVKVALSLITLTLFHTTYLMWSIECSCGAV